MTKKKQRTTTDGLEILDRLYFRTPARQQALAKARLNAEIAQEIYAGPCRESGDHGVGHLSA